VILVLLIFLVAGFVVVLWGTMPSRALAVFVVLLVSAPGPAHAEAVATVDTANTQRLLTMLRQDTADVSVLVLSDSTGNDTWEWPYLTARHLADTFPEYTVHYRLWDRFTDVYGPVTVLHGGSGTHTLRFWNASAPARSTRYHLGGNFRGVVVAARPDHVFLAHGHNEGVNADSGLPSPDEQRWRGQFLALSESVATAYPRATLTVVLQNPQVAGVWSARRVAVYRDIAAQRGYGVVDAYSVFRAHPGWAADWMTDNSHPNAAGMTAWGAEMARHLRRDPADTPLSLSPSPLARAGRQILSNCRFGAFTGPTPSGWTAASGAVAVKDTAYRETGSWGVRVQGARNARLTRVLPGWAVNRWVTVAARVRLHPGSIATAGRIGLTGGTSTVVSRDDRTEGQGAFRWEIVSNRIGSRPGTVLLYGSGVTSGRVTFDRVSVVSGNLPAEC
jgi:hypothetical protein